MLVMENIRIQSKSQWIFIVFGFVCFIRNLVGLYYTLTTAVYSISMMELVAEVGNDFFSDSFTFLWYLAGNFCYNAMTTSAKNQFTWFDLICDLLYFRKEQIEDGKLLLNCHHYFMAGGIQTGKWKTFESIFLIDFRPYTVSCCCTWIERTGHYIWRNFDFGQKHKISGKYGSNWKTINLMRWKWYDGGYRVKSEIRESLAIVEKGRQVHYII